MAYNFDDASTEYISWANVAALNGATEFTVAGWVNLDDTVAAMNLFGTRTSGSNDGFFTFYDDTGIARNVTYVCFIETGTANARIEGAANAAVSGTWQHVCATFVGGSATGLRLYIDGAEDANSPVDVTSIANSGVASGTFRVGGVESFPAYLDGKLAEVAAWNRALTAGEVAQLGKAYSPLFIPRSLVFYAPLVRGKQNLIGGTVGSDGGTPDVSDHPRIIYPAPLPLFKPGVSVSNIEQFWDTTNHKLRDPGSDGSNPSGFQPLVCHQSPSASHVTNTGSGGDADAGSNSGDDTSPGTYSPDV